DGKVLTAAVGGAIHRWDAATGGPLTPQSAADSAIDWLIVTPDGKRLITHDEGGTADLWDAAAGRHLRRVPAAWQRGLALSPDGRFLVWPVEDEKVQFKDPAQPNATHTGSRLRLYDLTAGKFVERFPGFEGDAWNSMFTPDGGTLLPVDYRGAAVPVWDVASGQVRRSFRAVREDEKAR